MRKLILTALVAMSSGIATFSDNLTNGFYRVSNFKSGQYVFLYDCTGNISSDNAFDIDAIQLLKNTANDFISDPGSILYVEKLGSYYDIHSQNTSIYFMTKEKVTITQSATAWTLYYGGKYLYDIGCSKSNKCQDYTSSNRTYIWPGTNSEFENYFDYRKWNVVAVSSSSTNYFGFKPSVKSTGIGSYYTNNKYFAPFFASFAYKPVSTSVKTWYISKIDEEKAVAVISEITGQVAPSQPVFIECAGSTTAGNKVDIYYTGGTKATSNILNGAYFCNGERTNKDHTGKDPAVVPFDSKTMRVLGTDSNGNLAFVSSSTNLVKTTYRKKWNEASSSTTGLCIPHNTSYLPVSENCPETLLVLTQEEYEKYKPTAITEVRSTTQKVNNDVYTISGQKVNQMQSGQMYIVGGKKIIKY